MKGMRNLWLAGCVAIGVMLAANAPASAGAHPPSEGAGDRTAENCLEFLFVDVEFTYQVSINHAVPASNRWKPIPVMRPRRSVFPCRHTGLTAKL